jgi:hypothetical protein
MVIGLEAYYECGSYGIAYLGVACQHCGEPIPVPERLLSRQVVVSDAESNPANRHVSTLLNLRCRACRKEYFYDVSEISEYEGTPRHTHGAAHRHSVPPLGQHALAAHK